MAFDFPSTPTEGQKFTPAGGPEYIYHAPAWELVEGGGTGTGLVSISDTPPASPLHGQQWWESDTGLLWIRYNDGSSSQWVIAAPQPDLSSFAKTADANNRIVNGAAQISQENGMSSVTAHGAYPADQWMFSLGGATGAVGAAHQPGPSPNGSVNIFTVSSLSVNASPPADTLVRLEQPIEGARIADFGWGTAAARPAVLRFWLQATVVGTYSVAVRSYNGDRSFVAPIIVSAANTWVEYKVAIPPITTGTWAKDNTCGATVAFCLAIGTTFQTFTPNVWVNANVLAPSTMSNGIAANGQYIQFADVGLYLDPLNTGLAPRWEMPDEPSELAACQRYYYKVVTDIVYPAPGTTYAYNHHVYYPINMRAAPSITYESVSSFNLGTLTVAIRNTHTIFCLQAANAGNVAYSFIHIASARM